LLLLRDVYSGPEPVGDVRKLLPPDDPGLRVIKADITRTFPYIEVFQDVKVQAELELMLSCYCREFGIAYKQGMNFIFAVFFLIGLNTRQERYPTHSMQLINRFFF
jgi:hypothetical protein